MDVFGPSKYSGFIQEPFLVCMEQMSLATCENNKYYVQYIMRGKRALLQRKLSSSKCAAAIGLPGGLWEMAYMGMPTSTFWQ